MAKKLQLQIPEPCHEDWEKMSGCEKGKFCNSCQKTVVDFTGMSDAQLVIFFRKPIADSLCGRFNDQQLEREIAIPQKRIPWLKYMLQLCLPVFLVNTKAVSQGKPSLKLNDTIPTCTKLPGNSKEFITGELVNLPSVQIELPQLKNRLYGRIVNENDDPVPNASVVIKGTKKGTNSDADGYFNIKINPGDKFVALVTSSIGYETNEKDISNNAGSINKIVLKNDLRLLNEVVVTSYGSIRKGGIVGSFSMIKESEDSITNKIRNFFVKDPLRVYPNPARSGGEIKIETSNSQTGDRVIELFSLEGQMISSTLVNNYSENSLLTYRLPNVVAGSYLVRITNKKSGKVDTQKIIIL
jgi:hypothetical protein